MPSLIEFLKAQDPKEVEEKRTALLGVLREINNALQKSDGPYFGGQDVNAADLRVAPQLKHVIIGTKSLKVCTQLYGEPSYGVMQDKLSKSSQQDHKAMLHYSQLFDFAS